MTPSPLMISLPEVTTKVLDLFMEDPLACTSRKSHHTSDDDLDAVMRDVERLERE